MNTRIFKRILSKNIESVLERGKSVLLLGPRQTGKTTLVTTQIQPNISLSFAQASVRTRYEKDIVAFERELLAKIKTFTKKPIIFIDEVQKIPQVMDVIQYFIDENLAQFILSGSSARKLKHGRDLNLLPGRVVVLILSSLTYAELPTPKPDIETLLLYGSLPGIIKDNLEVREEDLSSYVTIYLEEEIREEALVRNIGSFARFLEIAASDSGKIVNFTRTSQEVGVADSTIANYYQILEDCLIAHRIEPITSSKIKRRLMKSPRYLWFDLGIRRLCANEGLRLPMRILAELFEHYVGNELIRYASFSSAKIKLKYWRDTAGAEIDYVIDSMDQYIPIEVKWSDKPELKDARHLLKFIDEYSEATHGFIVCRTPQSYQLTDNITVLPWQELQQIISYLKTD